MASRIENLTGDTKMMTKQESMVMDMSDIRRMASGSETPAGASLIESNLTADGMSVSVLTRVCPLSQTEAEYVMACVAVADCDADDWDSVPEHRGVDYAYCDDASDAHRVAFVQLLRAACERVIEAVDAGDDE